MTKDFTLDDLAALIASRSQSSADKSYTKSLLEAGVTRVAKKFGEEAVEAVIAAVARDKVGLKMEAADVLYHLLVLLQDGGVPLQDVIQELARRTQQSGHQEKASRASQGA
ncbi:phosphoribosyl-ATP pyrophosphatase [Rhodoblastus acidophilus]|uniref:Phosphoribosyl-ATP pyrophosphatase n=1 Tax=Rhodoblastus acidophilus TaxID=1074 RepID=A0A212RL94_RHOAC|nr:phosphoribosyl-ATP diphosphatase [Rhodoblastus acidophilus]MCW2315858.1 phosphoribosyl-ATP pyrophosphohydrolase [Rhodoblastus acidophilus]PPQ39068.1 phosphoribosyl-ATP diphosphatase [Rhodoblastus acidophilus]RAI24222.1 phosphoribosyl-ATP diphosphatase [Rhodoblastus acidophilus]SNB73175.1 phosphoribosyl-ATP pyrophosphatase [Rhodoblastus acidophilus]